MADFISYIFDTVFYVCENYDTGPQDIVERGLLLLDDDVSLYAGGDQRGRVSGCWGCSGCLRNRAGEVHKQKTRFPDNFAERC